MARLAALVLTLVCLALAGGPAVAGEADVLEASAHQGPDGRWTITATLRHADTGWDHYADAFEVLGPDGVVLGRRVLHHPHVTEQPFTRSLHGLSLPPTLDRVLVRAHDSVHGHGGATVELRLPR